MNIGKGMYTFNITEIKKQTSKWIIKINKKHTWDKFVENFLFRTKRIIFFWWRNNLETYLVRVNKF